ncbi:hypothetical protein [Brevibacillus sp. AY1]|uniref:hypothetical protein n=1 Tax=Brevibacillus sp. AY1 TaxID=2807621 RepID=UPI0024562239|nr:hypothetical protein [Brevibacillus sp. AY1]MDH4616593.1 hypothetical protein [Brevibacillus sp. AY1]
MKRVIILTLSLISIVIIISIITCPTDDDYFEWLSDKYNISCTSTPKEMICKENTNEIEWNSRYIKSAGIYQKVEDNYSSSNTIYEMKVIGLFGIFIDYSTISIKN